MDTIAVFGAKTKPQEVRSTLDGSRAFALTTVDLSPCPARGMATPTPTRAPRRSRSLRDELNAAEHPDMHGEEELAENHDQDQEQEQHTTNKHSTAATTDNHTHYKSVVPYGRVPSSCGRRPSIIGSPGWIGRRPRARGYSDIFRSGKRFRWGRLHHQGRVSQNP